MSKWWEIRVSQGSKDFATSEALKTLESNFVGVPSITMVLFGGAIRAMHFGSSDVRLFPNIKVFSSAALINKNLTEPVREIVHMAIS